MERELEQAVRARLKAQVMDALLAANPIEVPQSLVEQEIRDMQIEALRRMGATNARQLPPRAPFEAGAKRRVALGLLLNEVIRKHSIVVDPARVQATARRHGRHLWRPGSRAQAVHRRTRTRCASCR